MVWLLLQGLERGLCPCSVLFCTNYSVVWFALCWLNVLIIRELFCNIPKLCWNNSSIASAIKIPKIIPTGLAMRIYFRREGPLRNILK